MCPNFSLWTMTNLLQNGHLNDVLRPSNLRRGIWNSKMYYRTRCYIFNWIFMFSTFLFSFLENETASKGSEAPTELTELITDSKFFFFVNLLENLNITLSYLVTTEHSVLTVWVLKVWTNHAIFFLQSLFLFTNEGSV